MKIKCGHCFNPQDLNDTIRLRRDTKETAVSRTDLSKAPSDVQLSISTIASAIANASLNSDPAQLAAMIIELSQKSHFMVKRTTLDNQNESVLPDQSHMTVAAQGSTVYSSMSDMEKYLKKVEHSASDSEVYSSESCVDILGLTDGRDVSHRVAEAHFENHQETDTDNFDDKTKFLSTSCNGTEGDGHNLTAFQPDGKEEVISRPKDLTSALEKLSPLNCNLPNPTEAALKSILLGESKAERSADRSKTDAAVKLSEVSSQACGTAALGTWSSVKGNDQILHLKKRNLGN